MAVALSGQRWRPMQVQLTIDSKEDFEHADAVFCIGDNPGANPSWAQSNFVYLFSKDFRSSLRIPLPDK
jgi:hypothetical protein